MTWDLEQVVAIAAATYAIHSTQESIRNDTIHGPDKFMIEIKSKAKDTEILPELRKIAPKFSDETSQRSFKDAKDTRIIPEQRKVAPKFTGETSQRSFEDAKDTRIMPELRKVAPKFSHETSRQRSKDANGIWITPEPHKSPPKLPGETSKQSFKDPANQELEKARVRDQAMAKPEPPVPKRDRPPTGWSMNQPVEARRDSVRKPEPTDYVADAWTKEEMESIKGRYGRLRATIDDWEAKKKRKANAKMERTEAKLEKKREEAVVRSKMDMRMKGKLDKKRAEAVKKYRSKIARIEEIAAGARAQAEENRRNEEFKVKEKANRIRLTGELPKQCPCF